MTGGHLNANIHDYLAANTMNELPPVISSDALVAGGVPIEQLLHILGLAANATDPTDNAESREQHALRDAATRDAAAAFSADDENSATELKNVAEQSNTAIQQLPQIISGITGAITGAFGGALQPLASIPQQALQTGMGMLQNTTTPSDYLNNTDLTDIPLFDEFDDETFSDSQESATPGGGLPETTTPTATLGPPPIPTAVTSPSSIPTSTPPTPHTGAVPPPRTGPMTGMPFIPPGAMRGTNETTKEATPDTKRISVPSVKNGAPVQGRITTPPTVPVTKKITETPDGKPVATKRIIIPHKSPTDEN